MVSVSDIKKILEIAVDAPSGSNSQPWRFEFKESKLKIFALPEKDHPILNYRNRGTWVALGALLENLSIASEGCGYQAKILILPDFSESKCVSEILFSSIKERESIFARAISKRITNRKIYRDQPLSEDQKNFLFKDIPLERIAFTESTEGKGNIGKALSMNEVVMLGDQKLHQLFFDEIVWSEKEELERKSGLYLKTMELKPPQEKLLRLLKNWKIMSVLNRIGFPYVIARDNAKVYSSGSLLVSVIVDDNDVDFIEAGRLMERIWLRAVSLGLSGQIVSGIPFLWQRLVLGNDNQFLSTQHQALVREAYDVLIKNFAIKNGIISLVLRLGFADPPSTRSSRLIPNIRFLDESSG